MNKPMNFLISLLILMSITAVSCKTTGINSNVMDINGMIYDFSNRPVPNCDVKLGSRYKGTTDINGRFTIPNVSMGSHTFSGMKAGYETYCEEIDIRDRGQIIYIRIPSQNQLLNLADEALSANNLSLADELAERALIIDNQNIESIFYCAAVKFRINEFEQAMDLLETARLLDPRNIYVEKFLIALKEAQNE